MNYDYMHANWGGKDCYVVFMDKSYYQKVKVGNINALGVSAYEYKLKDSDYVRKSRFDMTIPDREFSESLIPEICFYPWGAIRKIQRVSNDE